MRKNNTFIFLTLLFPLVLSCDSVQKKSVKAKYEINIDLDLKKNENTKDFFEYESFIALETTESSIIKEVNKVVFNKDKIFILDIGQSSVFVFTKEGRFMGQINRKGQGPEEYLMSSDFYIDDDRLCVYDGLQGSLITYTIHGDFINRTPVSKGYECTKTEKGNWLFYLANGNADSSEKESFDNIIICDKDFNVITQHLPFNKHLLGRVYSYGTVKYCFPKYDDQIYINPFLDNNIYKYNPDNQQLELEYHIVFNKYTDQCISEDQSNDEVMEWIRLMNQNEIPSTINNFYKKNNTIFFHFRYNNSKGLLFCIYNEDTGSVDLCDYTFDDNGLFFNPVVYSSDEQQDLVMSILNGTHIGICRDIHPGSPVVQKIISTMDKVEDSNPVLVFYSMKDK